MKTILKIKNDHDNILFIHDVNNIECVQLQGSSLMLILKSGVNSLTTHQDKETGQLSYDGIKNPQISFHLSSMESIDLAVIQLERAFSIVAKKEKLKEILE